MANKHFLNRQNVCPLGWCKHWRRKKKKEISVCENGTHTHTWKKNEHDEENTTKTKRIINEKNLNKITEGDGWLEKTTGPDSERRMRKKTLAGFVWQQQAEEPQGHANERKAFQQ